MVASKNRYMKYFLYLSLLLCLVLSQTSCTTTKRTKHIPRTTRLQATSFDKLTNWHQDDHREALQEFKKSCSMILKRSPTAPVSFLTKLGGLAADWHKPCLEATLQTHLSKQEAKSFFEKWFTPYIAQDKHGNNIGQFTGYYEIELTASLKKTKRFKYPIYMIPPNINKLKGNANFTHAAINKGILDGKKLEIAWVDNRARLFLLHVQGSGVLKLPNGKELKVGFADHNGYSYRSIHPLLVKHMGNKAHSTPNFLHWLEQNPKLGRKIMEHNPSYVFFKIINGRSPIGGQGVPLRGERSIAIDSRLYPYGAPIWVQTNRALRDNNPNRYYHRLFIAQDTGGAIKGAVRADIFFGRGQRAELLAGSMNQKGKYFILFPKKVKVPTSYHAKW
jgi:membrane-bound lytic murein transglycosylase A